MKRAAPPTQEVKWRMKMACETGDLPTVREMIESGTIDVNEREIDGDQGAGATAVIEAACGQHLEVVKYLIQRRADLTIGTRDDNATLYDYASPDILAFLADTEALARCRAEGEAWLSAKDAQRRAEEREAAKPYIEEATQELRQQLAAAHRRIQQLEEEVARTSRDPSELTGGHRFAKQAVMYAHKMRYRIRRVFKRDRRKLWIKRVSNNSKLHGIRYNVFICRLKEKNININRKILSQLGVYDRAVFTNVLETAIPEWKQLKEEVDNKGKKKEYSVKELDDIAIPYFEATVPELYTDPTIRFNRQVKDWGVEYTIDFGDEEEWRDVLPKMPELANFQLPDHMLTNSRRQLEEIPIEDRMVVPDEEKNSEYKVFMDKVRAMWDEEEEKKAKGEEVRPKKEPLSNSEFKTAPPGLSCGAAMTVDTAATSTIFDFDELEKAYAKIDVAAGAAVDLTDEEAPTCDGLDDLSEVWPGDVPSSEDDLADLPELVPGPEYRPGVWEVCVLRVIVRREPDVDAAVQSLCHEKELLFEELGSPENDDWVRLERQRGYVLKDGSIKDPKLGLLVRPFHLKGVPSDQSENVMSLLRTAWRNTREQNGLLRPPLVAKLRRAEEDAVSAALSKAAFDFDAFQTEYQRGVDTVLSEQGFLAQARMLMQRAVAVGNQSAGKLRYAPSERTKTGMDQAAVSDLIDAMRSRTLPSQEDAIATVAAAARLLGEQPTLVRLQLPAGATVHVVGDVHGQFWDLLHILELCGDPSPQNHYLFNGDFVDRGQFSVEVALLLLAMKVAAPSCVHLNRGNHEAVRMNALYGFMQETEQKYSNELFRKFAEAFNNLPLATLVNDSVFVVHGGLSSKEGVLLSEIAQLDRKREPDEVADQLMLDLLWSDPMERDGYAPSPRGGGILFGPDVTQRFCAQNGLSCVIRSHEMKSEGYEWQRLGRCLTVFSAPNYCDMCGNLGAVCDIQVKPGRKRIMVDDLDVRTFECSPHPEEPHMANLMFRPFC
ncbi:ppt1 [Symbiodinium natans]|uniref:Serine/threonine-protein phosphatase n=1 Tax=Symbiodinium natans TaxID=878477 RepID=A0A812PDN2_9DINO|nr:ppt1 [Symbiodinium natans]